MFTSCSVYQYPVHFLNYSSKRHSASFLSASSMSTGEPQKSRLQRGRQNGGDVGLAQPSMDYDVDSNPEGWTEGLRVKGLCRLWAMAGWIRSRQPWSLLPC